MILWLDDIRPPWKHGYIGAEWAKTAEEAIELLKTGRVTFASLDHDLTEAATMGQPASGEKTGMTVLTWMIENNTWPSAGVRAQVTEKAAGSPPRSGGARNAVCGCPDRRIMLG